MCATIKQEASGVSSYTYLETDQHLVQCRKVSEELAGKKLDDEDSCKH